MISIGSTSAAQAFAPAVGMAPAPAPVAAPASAPSAGPAVTRARLAIPGDADPCTSCGRDEIEQAYELQAFEQGRIDADVLAQVAATYAASRLTA